MGWISIKDEPLEIGMEVLAYNKEWIDEDFNPNGVRIGCLNGDGSFISAVWNSTHDCYGTCQEEGDDYECSQQQDDGTVNTWYYRNGERVFGHRPNMPTHYMKLPTFKE